ncbi:MAG: transposase family protein, partial [Coprobacillus sp.]
MSNINYINDLLKSLELFHISGFFFPSPFKNTDSCFRFVKNKNGTTTRFVHIVSSLVPKPCPHCGSINRHHSKGTRTIYLTHKSNGLMKTILEVSYRRYECKDCHRYFKENIPFQFYDTHLTT